MIQVKDDSTLDLHGRTVSEALSAFIAFYNDRVRRGKRGLIEVIHGYGSSGQGGAIQKHLRDFLSRHPGSIGSWVEGDAIGNPGITKIYPNKLLPTSRVSTQGSAIRDAILKQCQAPKNEQKIITRLCGRFGDRVVKEEIARLVQEGSLQRSNGLLQTADPSS